MDGVGMASAVIDSSRALETLQKLVDFTQKNKSH
jgi:anthranilate phosphoribosyltransferase